MKDKTRRALLSLIVISLLVVLNAPAQTLKSDGPAMATYTAQMKPVPAQPLPVIPAPVMRNPAPPTNVRLVLPGERGAAGTNRPAMVMPQQPIFTNHMPVLTNRIPAFANRIPVSTN